jgi:hypothetical protein
MHTCTYNVDNLVFLELTNQKLYNGQDGGLDFSRGQLVDVMVNIGCLTSETSTPQIGKSN